MKLLFILFLFAFTCIGQENPWKTNNQENTSESVRGQNPWTSSTPLKKSESVDQIMRRFPSKSIAFNYGYHHHISPKGVLIPSIAVAVPALGILAIPLVPLITAIPFENRESEISNSYRKKKPEATDREIYDVKNGIRLKRWRNSGIGTAIGASVQAILLFLIIEVF